MRVSKGNRIFFMHHNHYTLFGPSNSRTHLTSSPDALGGVRVFPAEEGFMPRAKQVTNFDPIAVIDITMDNVLLGAPVARLNRVK